MADLKEINRLALPAIIYNITEPLIGLVDTAFIGQIPDHPTEAQGGVGLAVGLLSTLIWGLSQVRTAVSAIISKYLGQNKLDEIKSLIPQSIAFVFILGVFFWLITSFFFDDILLHLYENKNQITRDYANNYFQIRSIGLPLSLILAGLFGIFRGYQNTSYAMIIALIGGSVNVILDAILVNGVAGISPAYGVGGAAYASLFSQLIMVILGFYFLIKKTPFHLKLDLNFNPEFNNMLMISLNMFIRTLALNIAFLLALRFAGNYGDEELAAYSIGINIWLFSSFFIDGYSNAGNAIAGKYFGTNDLGKLFQLSVKLIRINVIVGVLLGVSYLILSPFLIDLFSSDENVRSLFMSFFWIIILALPINSVAYTLDGVFKGMGKAKLLRNLLLTGTFGIFIPILYISDHFGMKIYSIWMAFLAWMLWRSLVLLHYLFKTTKNEIIL